METGFILTFKELKKFFENNEALNNIDGCCDKCSQKKFCYTDNKNFHIDGMLHMKTIESRFPKLLDILQKHPNILYLIPSSVFKSFYGLYHQAFSCPFNTTLIFNNLVKIERVYNLLSDEISKMVFLNLIMYRITQNRDYVQRAYSMDPQYFILPFRGLGTDEVYVDCGAYNGDSFISYCQYNDVPKKAYLFEPDYKNSELMVHSLMNYKDSCDIKIIKKGTYKFTGNLYFVGGKGVNSHISETPAENSSKLDVTSIDDAIDEEVSFIKMDIEGSEKEALIGAEKHILSTYPRLAICIYHYNEDLWEIPLLIKEKFPRYKNFQIRHHSKFNTETVLYVY